jgi:hypothetical protein
MPPLVPTSMNSTPTSANRAWRRCESVQGELPPDDIAGRHKSAERVTHLIGRLTVGHINEDQARRLELLDEFLQRGDDFDPMLGELVCRGDAPGEANDIVPLLCSMHGYVRAHPAEPDDAELHDDLPPKRLIRREQMAPTLVQS